MSLDMSRWLLILPGILIGLTVHEYSHARAADYLGDYTSAYAGRLTLNPLAHIDLMGFLMLLLAGFGWAKPVPINPLKFRGNMRTGVALVSLAGPTANVVTAFTGALIFFLSFPQGAPANGLVVQMLHGVVQINLVLAIFNLIPIPPLDGSKILASVLPAQFEDAFLQLERYGPLLLIILVFSGFFGKLLIPLLTLFMSAVYSSAGLIAQAILSLI